MISREKLYELVWAKPMTKVAEQFDVSSSYMGRVCTLLNVPRPERGYWMKLEAGKAPERPPLPEAEPGDRLFWSRGDELPPVPRPRPVAPVRKSARTSIPKTATHRLILGAREHFEAGRRVEDGAYLKPYKRLLVDVTASQACLDKVLRFANALFNEFEAAGYRVVLAASDAKLGRGEIDEREKRDSERPRYHHSSLWSPDRPTVVYVGTVAIGLVVLEMSEHVVLRYVDGKYIRDADYKPPRSSLYRDNTWTTTRDIPSGRLRLVAYSPYYRVSWQIDWQETKDAPLDQKMAAIVRSIEKSAPELVTKIEEEERQAEIRHRQWLVEQEERRKKEDKRQIQQSVRASQEHLGQIIKKWAEVMSVEQFFAGVEDRASALPDGDRVQALERLQLAREFLGTQNPLDFFLAWQTPSELYAPLYNHPDELPEAHAGQRPDE